MAAPSDAARETDASLCRSNWHVISVIADRLMLDPHLH